MTTTTRPVLTARAFTITVFNQTSLKAINQSLTNYNINPDMGAVRAMVEDGLPPLELGLDPTW